MRQVGPYLPQAPSLERSCSLYERIGANWPLVYQLFRQEHRWVAKSGTDKRWKHLSAKQTSRLGLIDSREIIWLIGCRCKCGNALSRAVLINHTSSWLAINDHKYFFPVIIAIGYHLFLPHYSKAECGTPLTLRIPNVGYKSGDYTEDVPLLPIPNRIVKFLKADDSP